ncbi:AraC family transcriptional regulator [Mucilaginibacter sp. UR6-1]|nr:AraC family transcriptional regulator [Mucilaginibacter sp. UR6-1]
MARYKQFAFKQFGYFDIGAEQNEFALHPDFAGSVKVAFVKAGGNVTVDFKGYQLEQDALFFISAGQYYQIADDSRGTMIYYNRDFYCVAIHDKEVACDGLLFHNVYEIPVILLSDEQSAGMQAIIAEIKEEIVHDDSSMEEMLRILLKSIIIKATRIYKLQHNTSTDEARQEVEFSRKFSQLVEWHYARHHTVAEYAELLNMTPKALNKRITRNSDSTPNDIIKNRIILEAKRLLVHTDLSVKEIGYKLGYDDPSYFIRLFTNQTSSSPQNFRQQYQHATVA